MKKTFGESWRNCRKNIRMFMMPRNRQRGEDIDDPEEVIKNKRKKLFQKEEIIIFFERLVFLAGIGVYYIWCDFWDYSRKIKICHRKSMQEI